MKKNIYLLITILLIILFFYIGYSKLIKKSPFVSIFNIGMLQVTSGSMEPNIKVGEIIIILKTKDYNEGDIVTICTKNNNLITHRIIKKEDKNYITKGDFNNIQDEDIITKENIKGKVIFHSKFLGMLCKYKNIIFLIIMFLLCIKRKKELL